jgi:hypothetical protein
MAEKQTDNEDQVKLPKIMGIRPGVYLTVIYSIIILAVLFFLLFLPGLTKPGAVLFVKTEPSGAAIRVDGVYMGTSHSKIPLRKGTHTIEAVLPGFEPHSATHKVPGRIFGARFFPLRYNVEYVLKTDDSAAAFALAAADYAAWTFGGEPTATWQIPLSLSEGAYRVGSGNGKETAEILKAASRFAVTRAALRDLIRAKTLVDNGGNSPSPVSLTGSISDILAFLSENQGSAQWLAGLLPPEAASVVKESAWYKKELSFKTDNAAMAETSALGIPSPFVFYGLSFRNVSDFMISETSVPDSVYEVFLNDTTPHSPLPTPHHVTWNEAKDFCQWLTARHPPSMSRFEIRLPTENEWVNAAIIIENMKNAGWEWCADPYAPLDFITASPAAIQTAGSPERSLRKGIERSSLPPHLSSPFVSFRPVIAEKE